MKWFKKHELSFVEALKSSLPHGFTLPNEVLHFIKWLESEKQVYQYRNTQELFLPTIPVKSVDHLRSHFAFIIEPTLTRDWFGKEGLEQLVVPIVKCGADGSYLAIWKNGENNSYVFLGSEGEAFTITKNVENFLVLLTMGYISIESRFSFSLSPAENCHSAWAEPTYVQNHLKKIYGVLYPETAAELIEPIENDLFVKFVEDACS